jgi:CubicO group peptidase (beta-lactamase class C family)
MSIDFVYWLAQTPADHRRQFALAQSRGYRTVSLCVSGKAPVITAVMVKDPTRPLETFELIPEKSWSTTLTSKAADGVGPYIVSAVGPRKSAVFAAVFRNVDPSPLVLNDLDQAGLAAQQDGAWRSWQVIGSIDAYGTPNDPRFVAIWIPNAAPVAWNVDAASTPVAISDFRARLNATADQGGRLSLVTRGPDRKYVGLFVDEMVPTWRADFELNAAQLSNQVNAMQQRGLAPLRVVAKDDGANTVFSVIFADSEQGLPRTMRSSGPASIRAFDSLMEDFMQKNATRGAALAVTAGTKLVYAKGYTLAEARIPDVLPTTVFRLASVSKLLGAIAIYQLIQEGKLALDQTVQSVLALKSPNGGPPVDERFECVTVRDLLTMTAAVDQGAFWESAAAADAFGKPLPATPAQMLSLIASRNLSSDPGNWDNVDYNNTGYMLLGLIVARLRGAADFASAIVTPLLTPLGITRIRGSRSLLRDQAADEAGYYLTNLRRTSDDDGLKSLDVGQSVRAPGGAMVPAQYGAGDYEMFGAGGGMSAAATDLARILAALTWRDKRNPMLSEMSLQALFANTVRATAALTGADPRNIHGYFGWDFNWFNPDGSLVVCKGGWLPGNQSFACLSMQGDGVGVVLLINTNEQDDSGSSFSDLRGAIAAEAGSRDWSVAGDLFPSFGMSSFVPRPIVKQPPLLQPPDALGRKIDQAFAAERFSMVPPPAVEARPSPRARPRRKRAGRRR